MLKMLLLMAALCVLGLLLLATYDLFQRKHAILRNFPIIGHFRYWLEAIGPELRQYIVTDNDEERPFTRDQRRWVYSSSKKQNNYFGFGTDNDLELAPHTIIIRQSAFPLTSPRRGEEGYDPSYGLPCAKVLGEARGRAKAFRPNSVVNISAMSYGSLSHAAVEALNRGAEISGCLHNTGEGGVSPHHKHGGDLVWQIGTGYFGCRAEDGNLSRERYLETLAISPTVKAIELKLSQGAKPGLGGLLPAAKITPEISKIRGIPMGRDCVSPSAHRSFSSVDEMLDLVEELSELGGGIPVGIKSAVGDLSFFVELAELMARGDRGVDFIAIDGGEGGTGAAPLVFSDCVAMPFKIGFSEVYRIFAERDLTDRVLFVGSGKLGLPDTAAFAFALGCDLVNVAREAMLAVGCIQAQRCHSGHCPTGVATQNRWLIRGLDPTLKAARCANYVVALRKELQQLARACGVPHPAWIPLDRFELLSDRLGSENARNAFRYEPDWGLPQNVRSEPS